MHWLRTEVLGAEPVDQETVPEAPVAHREGVLAEFRQDGPHDEGPGEDHVGAIGLQARDPAPLRGGTRGVELDLEVEVGAFEPRAVDDGGIVGQRGRASRPRGS